MNSLFGNIMAGFLMTGKIIYREKYGRYFRNLSRFPAQSYASGKVLTGKNLTKYSKNRHFISAMILSSKFISTRETSIFILVVLCCTLIRIRNLKPKKKSL